MESKTEVIEKESVFVFARRRGQGWVKKKKEMWYICTMEYYSTIKKNEIMPFAVTWKDLEIIILSEVSQTGKDKYHMILLICGI